MPKFGLPKTVGYPKNTFAIFFVLKNDYKAVCKWFFGGLSAVQSFVQNKQVWFIVIGAFAVGFNNVIRHGFGFKLMCFAHAPPIKFFQKKKRKKKKAVC